MRFRSLGFSSFGFKNLGFRSLGLRSLGFSSFGFKNLGFRSLGFRRLGFRSLGFKSLGFGSLGFRVYSLGFMVEGLALPLNSKKTLVHPRVKAHNTRNQIPCHTTISPIYTQPVEGLGFRVQGFGLLGGSGGLSK